MFLVKDKPATFEILTRFYKSDHVKRVSSSVTIRSELISGSFSAMHTDLAKKSAIALLKAAGYENSDIHGEVIFSIMGRRVSRKEFDADVKNTLRKMQIKNIVEKYL